MSDSHGDSQSDGGGAPQRYELDELFPEESPSTLHTLRVAGGLVVALLVLLALLYPIFRDFFNSPS